MDKKDQSKKLSGAKFEIWSAKPSGEWTAEPDEKLGTYTTDAKGEFIAELPYGTYFWREVQAPSGYIAEDTDYHSFRIIKGVPLYEFTIANIQRPPDRNPGNPSYTIEIKKVDKETRESLSGAEFELWSAKLSDDGVTYVPDKKLLEKNLVTGKYGLVSVSVSGKGKFFYREVKAPSGYEADSEFHLIDTGTTLELITRVEMENEKTNIPEEPEKPDKPEKPEKPYKPGTPIKPQIPTDVPKTGERMPLYPLLLFLILSLFGLVSCKSAQK